MNEFLESPQIWKDLCLHTKHFGHAPCAAGISPKTNHLPCCDSEKRQFTCCGGIGGWPCWIWELNGILIDTWAVLVTSFSKTPTQPNSALARKIQKEIWIWSEWNWITLCIMFSFASKVLSYMESEGLNPWANQGAFVLACCWGLFLQKLLVSWTVQQQNWQIHHLSYKSAGCRLIPNRSFLVLFLSPKMLLLMLGLHWIFVFFQEVPAKQMQKTALYFS